MDRIFRESATASEPIVTESLGGLIHDRKLPLTSDACRLEPLELLGGWDLDFDDQEEMKQRLPQLTALCWDGPHGS